jgi:hypothetical protein
MIGRGCHGIARQVMTDHLVDHRDIEITGLLDQHETPDDGARSADPADAQPGRNGL